jgi:hypothetical protein
MAAPRLTLDELDKMSARERLDAFRNRVITHTSEVPAEVLDRFRAKARRLAADRE